MADVESFLERSIDKITFLVTLPKSHFSLLFADSLEHSTRW